jgi:predicted SAM-dependent methyltransferase
VPHNALSAVPIALLDKGKMFPFLRWLIRPIANTEIYHKLRRSYHLSAVRRQVKAADPLRVVLGAGNVTFDGWIATDLDVLDVRCATDWERLFKPESVDRLLSEHVFEHLTMSECKMVFAHARHYLAKDGIFRIAVPDGNRPDPAYLAEVSPPKDGHKLLFTVDTLVPLLTNLGYQVTPLEYFDAQGEFHGHSWNSEDGLVSRSSLYDRRSEFKLGDIFYTSLMIDAKKGN